MVKYCNQIVNKSPVNKSIAIDKKEILSKHLRLPKAIVLSIEEEAQEYGYNFNEWAKIILTERVKNLKRNKLFDLDLKERLWDGLRESNAGILPQLVNDKDIDEYVDQI